MRIWAIGAYFFLTGPKLNYLIIKNSLTPYSIRTGHLLASGRQDFFSEGRPAETFRLRPYAFATRPPALQNHIGNKASEPTTNWLRRG